MGSIYVTNDSIGGRDRPEMGALAPSGGKTGGDFRDLPSDTRAPDPGCASSSQASQSASEGYSAGGAGSQLRPYASLLSHSEIPGWESIPMDLREAIGILVSRHAGVFMDHRECAFVAALVVTAMCKCDSSVSPPSPDSHAHTT